MGREQAGDQMYQNGIKFFTITTCDISDALTHYGVKGMKWGVRKEYEPTGTKKFITKISKKDKVIKTDHGIGEIRAPSAVDRKIINDTLNDIETKLDRYAPKEEAQRKLDNFPRFNTRLTETQQIIATNKDRPSNIRSINCFECSMAYEMRRRGYNVQAKEMPGGLAVEYFHAFDIKDSFFLNVTPNQGSPSDKETLAKEAYRLMEAQCLSYGNGARGCLGIQYYDYDSGHSMNWVVEDGKFKIIDAQGLSDGYETFLHAEVTNSGITVCRLDNAEILPGVTDFVEPFEATEEEKRASLTKKAQPTMDKEMNPQSRRTMESESEKRREALRSANTNKRLRKRLEAGRSSVSKFIDKIGKTTTNLVSSGKSFLKSVFKK